MTHARTIHLFAAAALIATAVQPAIAQPRGAATLDQVVAFENPADPWLSEKSDRIFGAVWHRASASLTVPGIGLTNVSTTRGAATGWTHNRVALNGEWHGLTMQGFSLNGVPQSGVGAYVLHFDETPARVVATLGRLGFPVSQAGAVTRTGTADCGSKMSVAGEGKGASFTIAFTC